MQDVRRALKSDEVSWLALLLPSARDNQVQLSYVLMGACSVGAASCARLLIGAKAEIYTKISAGERDAGDTALNLALKAYSQPTDDQMKAGARACALMLLECSPGFGDKDSFIFSSEHAMDLISCCAPMELHGHLCGHGLLPAVELLLSARVDPNVAYDYNALIRDRVADDEGEANGLLFEAGSLLPLVVSCSMGSSPEVILALLAAGAKPKPALNAAGNPRFDLDGQGSRRLELIMHATRTRKLHGKAIQVEGLENRPELNGCRGTIAGVWAGLGRWPVLLVADDKVISLSVKCENVVLLPKDERQTPLKDLVPTCAGVGPGQDPACEDREASPLAISTTALEDSTASAEDDDGEVLDEDALAADGDSSHNREAVQMLMFLACRYDDSEGLREHLSNGASVDAVDADGHSPLFFAVILGHVACVKVLLEAKPHLNAELVCCAVEHPSVLALLLDAKASPNRTDKLQQSPLVYAGFHGQPESVQMLLDAGAQCDSDDLENWPCPAWARLSMMLDQHDVLVNQWHTECMHLLTQQDARLYSKESADVERLEQLLCDMCVQGTPTAIKTLLYVGVNPDATPTGSDAPPLVLACTDKSDKHLECVRVLLHGIRRRSRSPRTPASTCTLHSARPPLALVSPTAYPCSPGAGGANPALELNKCKFKTVMAAAAHFARRLNDDRCLRLMVEALQLGHTLGEFLPLESTRLRHSACLVRASQWEERSRWLVQDTVSRARTATCSATT